MAELLDRELYRKIKRMDRNTLESLIKEFYDMGRESAEEANVDIDALRADIAEQSDIILCYIYRSRPLKKWLFFARSHPEFYK